MDIEAIIDRVRQYSLAALKPARFEHCVRTAETASTLCTRFSLDARKGYLSGIAHDMCKEAPDRLLISLSERDRCEISALEAKKPSLLHGRAAAILLHSDFSIDNADVLNAVRYHTFGDKDMCDLAKVLYIADKIEPGRTYLPKSFYTDIEKLCLNDMCLVVLDMAVAALKEKGRDVSLSTTLFRKELMHEKKAY